MPKATGGPLSWPPVPDAPFSADAATILTDTLADGSRRQRMARSRYYRDRAGRVRVEQAIGVPLGGVRFLEFLRAQSLATWLGIGPDLVVKESLGTRHIGGVNTVGSRVTVTMPLGLEGNGEPCPDGYEGRRTGPQDPWIGIQSWRHEADRRSTSFEPR